MSAAFQISLAGHKRFMTPMDYLSSKEEIGKYLKQIRDKVEEGNYTSSKILYLYLPRCYFSENNNYSVNISILDVPGYETTNKQEKYHTDALLNKYMSISVLNIIVRSIYSINDLQYFKAPNRDDVNKLITGKYIIVTTRSYSQESILKYFKEEKSNREKSFEQMMEQECIEQFKRIFGQKIPRFFPVDLGGSFQTLVTEKIKDKDDLNEIRNYRDKIFKRIYEEIYSKQSNSLANWVQEVAEDEDFYGNVEIQRVEELILEKEDEKQQKIESGDKKDKSIILLEENIKLSKQKIEDWTKKLNTINIPDYDDIIDDRIKSYKKEYFSEQYEWKDEKTQRNVASHFADIFHEICDSIIDNETSNYDLIGEEDRQLFYKQIEEAEIELKQSLEKQVNPHAIFKFFNPPNKEKIEFGIKELKKGVPIIGNKVINLIKKKYQDRIDICIKKELNPLSVLQKENGIKRDKIKKELVLLDNEIKKLKKQKIQIEERIKKDKQILGEYRKIARKCFDVQYKGIVETINASNDKEEKLIYVILLGILSKDYKKIMME